MDSMGKIASVIAAVTTMCAVAFGAGGHMMNSDIHDSSTITRTEYDNDIKDIRASMRDIRQAIMKIAG